MLDPRTLTLVGVARVLGLYSEGYFIHPTNADMIKLPRLHAVTKRKCLIDAVQVAI